MRYLKYFEKWNNRSIIVISFLLSLLIALIRYFTGHEYAVSIFYLFPIILVSWNVGKRAGIFISFIGALSWLVVDLLMIDAFSKQTIPYINETFRLIVFLIITTIISELKKSIDAQRSLARTDPLTGMFNRRSFFEYADMELSKARRLNYPVSIIFLDLDNFKNVNDVLGHSTGDKLLHSVAETIKKNLRSIDISARFDGDEFCILLSATGSESSLFTAKKLQEKLFCLMRENGWPVTSSIGVATYEELPESAGEMVIKADNLMYYAKKNGKNKIEHKVISHHIADEFQSNSRIKSLSNELCRRKYEDYSYICGLLDRPGGYRNNKWHHA